MEERGIMPSKEKNILLIATGGTIASKPTISGLMPLLTSEEILNCVPEAASFCNIETLQLFNLDSTNMCHTQWMKIAETIREKYFEYDGFVITHGTDTMAYAAASLSYMIQNSKKPVVITGSQKSIYEKDTDARNNLIHAFLYASDERACGVHVIFDGKVILGTRARKIRTKSYQAFSSIDYPEVAVLRDQKLIYFIEEKVEKDYPDFYTKLCPEVFVLKLIPGLDPSIFQYLKTKYEVLIIESFGVGGIPTYPNMDFMEAIEDWINAGKTIVMTTQVPHEGSNMGVYQVGNRIMEQFELIEANNMTLEALVSKMMWILAQTKDRKEIRKMFALPVQKDNL